MNPDTHEQPSFNLPPPVTEAPAAASTEGMLPMVEQQPAPSHEAAPAQPAVPAMTSLPTDASAIAAQAQITMSTTAAQASAVPDDDTPDDKIWVMKAKQIIQQTADNPYEQNRQMAYIKAQYLEKRYGKVIKVAE